MISQWLTLLAILALAVIWIGALRSRERALAAARRICAAHSVQLLDESVGLSGLRVRRHNGLLQLMLRYGFEISLDGSNRYPGHLWMAGGRVLSINTSGLPYDARSDDGVGEQVADLLKRLQKHD